MTHAANAQLRTGDGATAIVPVRGGSKGIHRKNLRTVRGTTLIARSVEGLLRSGGVSRVVVTTDHPDLAAAAVAAGAEVIDRPAALAEDSTSSEAALLHALGVLARRGELSPVTVFAQATSPFLDVEALDDAIASVASGQADSVFAAVLDHGFLWTEKAKGARGIGHDHRERPRRQDRAPQYRETGSFYVFDTDGFLDAGHRFFGRIAPAVTRSFAALDIDEPEDLLVAEAIAGLAERQLGIPSGSEHPEHHLDVDAVVTDFDGVHTDDRASIDADGVERVSVHRGDGLGVRLLREAGLPFLILSTERVPIVAARAAKLGVDVVYGSADKASALRDWAETNAVPLERIAYLGNDVNDIPALEIVGWPVVVSDAHPAARAVSRLVLERRGGDGAVRELADLVLAARAVTHPEKLSPPQPNGA
ncbi:acylneuraminate cytidylyltransferase [Plantibacter sp. Leaf171]|uniref:acylneuraminate cytidylyltransferase n=1 Tax=unclassified Plantibacter TaxID=2624265 RepID=UPI0006FB830E|nr:MULTISPECIES: acylneuraminate cytidylyltransferase [unclassified Plantibacter]KQM14297.1 acylneuraminate cytidylyltransferase [Plantibacter sp. Leaf1]KQR57679.1 acylneuraminate cytidylyltransferase [Plantibacter sp. Leaf171]